MESGFEILGDITSIEIIATGRSIRNLRHLIDTYGVGRWRKLKGAAAVRLRNGQLRRAEIHWYEAHGIGKKDFKIKRYID